MKLCISFKWHTCYKYNNKETYLGPCINPAAPKDEIPLSLIMLGCCNDANNSASKAKSLCVNKIQKRLEAGLQESSRRY